MAAKSRRGEDRTALCDSHTRFCMIDGRPLSENSKMGESMKRTEGEREGEKERQDRKKRKKKKRTR